MRDLKTKTIATHLCLIALALSPSLTYADEEPTAFGIEHDGMFDYIVDILTGEGNSEGQNCSEAIEGDETTSDNDTEDLDKCTNDNNKEQNQASHHVQYLMDYCFHLNGFWWV